MGKNIICPEWDEIFNKHEKTNLSNHAFPLFLFISRLYENLTKYETKDVFFMSREGQFLKTLFDKYIEIRKSFGLETKDITTHYFLGSRNSIMTASVKAIDEEDFEYLFKFFNYFMTPKKFLYSIGFNDQQIDEVESASTIKMDKKCFNFKKSKTFTELIHNEKFREIYENNRQTQSQAFALYMDSFGVDYRNNGLVFVDIGYHGTMQDLIFKFFDEKIKTTGYFIKSRAVQSNNNIKIGLLGDKSNKKLFGSKITQYDAFNYEQFLRADHGRCLGYQIINNTSLAIIDTEYRDKEVYDKYVKTLQEQILDKFELIATKYCKEQQDISWLCVVYYYYTIKNKTKADYNWLLDMQDCHHDDFGYAGYPGKFFARTIRKITFKIKDGFFVMKNNLYIKKLKKQFIKNYDK